MPRRRFFHRDMLVLRAVLLVAAVAVSTFEAVGADPVAQPMVRESAPEIFYMQDDAGRLVPVPGFRYRDFVDLLRIKEGLPGLPEPPPLAVDWAAVKAELARRWAAAGAVEDCSVCLQALRHGGRGAGRRVELLSCTHALHAGCARAALPAVPRAYHPAHPRVHLMMMIIDDANKLTTSQQHIFCPPYAAVHH
jgi:hypothetical protein